MRLRKLFLPFLIAFTAPVLAANVTPSAPTLAQQLKACEAVPSTRAAMLVTVTGMRDVAGLLRIQVYSDDEDQFLEKGEKLVRVQMPVEAKDMALCVPFPKPGRYAVVVLHDRNRNGKADFFKDGFGFSNNPRLGLGKPDFDKVLITVPAGLSRISVKAQYVF